MKKGEKIGEFVGVCIQSFAYMYSGIVLIYNAVNLLTRPSK